LWEFVAGLGILLRVEDGLELVLWRRLYVVGIALLHRLTLADEELARVGRPIDAVAVVVADGAIVGELVFLAVGTPYLMDDEVVALDPCLPLAIGRRDEALVLFLVDLHPVALRLAEGRSPPPTPPRRGRAKTMRTVGHNGTDGGKGVVELLVGCELLLRVFVDVEEDKALALRGLHGVVEDVRGVYPANVLRPMVDVLCRELRLQGISTVVVVDGALSERRQGDEVTK
jgi:hypothetical protein